MFLFKIKEKIYLEKVRKDGMYLEKISDSYQTERICLEAVKQNGSALKFVKNQTEEICLEAVKQEARVLQFVENQTREMCLEAVKRVGKTVLYVKEQTPELCLIAVKNDPFSLEYISKQTERICFEAVKGNGSTFVHVKKPNFRIYAEALKSHIIVMRLKVPTDERLMVLALLHNPEIFEFFDYPTDEMKGMYRNLTDYPIGDGKYNGRLYRLVRYQIATGERSLEQSPYHVLECL